MRTNNDTHPAAVAFFLIQLKGGNIFKIYQSVHKVINFETIQAMMPNPAIPICAGTAVFISF
jgi:hypothetical protein